MSEANTRDRDAEGWYWLLTWVVLAAQLAWLFPAPQDVALGLYSLALVGTYAAMLALPAWLLVRLSGWVASPARVPAALLLGAALQLLLVVDRNLWQLYGFHPNGFVWSLLTARGGIEALGASRATFRDFAVIALVLIALQSVLWAFAALATRRAPLERRWLRSAVAVLLLVSLAERAAYAGAQFLGATPLLELAQRVPFYQPVTMNHLLERTLGLERPRRPEAQSAQTKGRLGYPLAPLRIDRPAQPLNLVWLVAESWRADTVNSRVMPQTYAFAKRASWFQHHYSGGNGTRIGLFSQFYSLPANLWFHVLDARVGSPLVDALLAQDYQIRLFTSAHFTYPEFDKTIWVRVPPDQMQETAVGPTWARDRKNVTDLLEFVDRRDPARPFMAFMFFESPHARYDFPPESVIEPDYLREFSYVHLDLERNIEGIRKRYLNAVHHLDSQLGRVLAHLETKGLLGNTVVVLTGDHGEEFLEKGRWGHNSTFVEEQLRVPLVLWLPGREPIAANWRTSHLDLLPTLLPQLGVTNPPSDYGVGRDLFARADARRLVVGDWDRLAFLGPEYKLVVPFARPGFSPVEVRRANDQPAADQATALRAELAEARPELQSFGRFLQR